MLLLILLYYFVVVLFLILNFNQAVLETVARVKSKKNETKEEK